MSAEPATCGPAVWTPGAIATYEDALCGGRALRVCDETGAALPFDLGRWLRAPDAADETVLSRCTGPTLDVGCGPGRLVAALGARGIPALGVDVAAAAVAIARAGGAIALRRSVFDRLPGSGRWCAALLTDGNIGIGAHAGGLLSRLRELLAPGELALVEVDPAMDDIMPGEQRVTATVRDAGGRALAQFPWLRIGAGAVVALAEPSGYRLEDQWEATGRQFVALQRC